MISILDSVAMSKSNLVIKWLIKEDNNRSLKEGGALELFATEKLLSYKLYKPTAAVVECCCHFSYTVYGFVVELKGLSLVRQTRFKGQFLILCFLFVSKITITCHIMCYDQGQRFWCFFTDMIISVRFSLVICVFEQYFTYLTSDTVGVSCSLW